MSYLNWSVATVVMDIRFSEEYLQLYTLVRCKTIRIILSGKLRVGIYYKEKCHL